MKRRAALFPLMTAAILATAQELRKEVKVTKEIVRSKAKAERNANRRKG